jgi:hypothetical protein
MPQMLRYPTWHAAAGVVLLGLPIALFRGAWEKYIVCPLRSWIDFDSATERFVQLMDELFEVAGSQTEPSLAFFPPEMRNTIMDAGMQRRLMRARYHGIDRIVEPYSLAYKRPRNGVAREYLYVWDRTGGRTSGPGIKTFLNQDIEALELLEERFEPRYEIELTKAGELPARSYFGKSFTAEGSSSRTPARPPTSRSKQLTRSTFGTQIVYVIGCPACGKRFERRTYTTQLNQHKNTQGWNCPARIGYIVEQRYR